MVDFTAKRIIRALTDVLSLANEGNWSGVVDGIDKVGIMAGSLAANRPEPMSPYDCNAPFGFDTAVSYAVRRAPAIMEFVTDFASFHEEQESALIRTALASGTVFTSVEPPARLRELGVTRCHAFPEFILRAHYGL